MPSFNLCVLAGNLTKDVELKFMPNGKAVAALDMAINKKWKDQAGATHEEVCYVNVVAFGKQAETAQKYLAKGSALMVEGELKFEAWTDKASGSKRSRLKVAARRIQFLGASRKVGDPATDSPTTPVATVDVEQIPDADIPF